MTTAIRIEGLGKRYTLGETHARTVGDQIMRLSRRLIGRAGQSQSERAGEFWALRDIDLDIAEGEAVGIIGGNGAGKSTLLKLLSRITQPTTGRARVRGRLSSLLEVGTGFHPELTGRENVFLNGTILGMRRSEVASKFDEIIAFAGIEQFVDTPVKRYSSGMYVRLAFAVAAHLEPDVLIIDEVLAVGDAEFQKRCIGKMSDVVDGGRTLLFVSHNLSAVNRLCSRCAVLDHGRLLAVGDTASMLMRYQGFGDVGSEPGECLTLLGTSPETKGNVTVESLQLTSMSGQALRELHHDQAFEIVLALAFENPIPHGIDIGIETGAGDPVVMFMSHLMGRPEFDALPRVIHRLRIPALPLAADDYFLSVRITRPGVESLYFNPRIARVRIAPRDIYGTGFPPVGARTRLALPASWHMQGEPQTNRGLTDEF